MSKLVAIVVFFSLLLVTGRPVPQMKWEHLMLMKAQAEKGDPEAQFLIGVQYRAGDGIDRDLVEAAKWFRKAAEAGQAEAQFALAEGYATGQGVPQDHAAAMKWYRLAAGQGNVEAQALLERIDAMVRAETAGNEAQLRPAARTGDQSAAIAPDLPVPKGRETDEDPAESDRWSKVLAGLKGADACLVRGLLLEQGIAVPQDWPAAAVYYLQAAKNGSVIGQYKLGICYLDGTGVEADLIEAWAWLSLAKSNGSTEAAIALDRIRPRLTPRQSAAAADLVQARLKLMAVK